MGKKNLILSIIGILGLFACNHEDTIMTEQEITPQVTENALSRGFPVDPCFSFIASGIAPELDTELEETFYEMTNYSSGEYYVLYELIYYTDHRIHAVFYDPLLNALGAYYPSPSFSMVFPSDWAVAEALPEEFLHFAQDYLYQGIIISDYYGNLDIEFEAKLVQDIVNVRNDFGHHFLAIGEQYPIEYREWLGRNFSDWGIFPNCSEISDYLGLSYIDFLDDWSASTNYSGTVNYGYPMLLDYLGNEL